jgi:predicted HTH domain antitoxin
MQVTIDLPDAIAAQLPAEPELRQARLLLELAVALYARGTISLAQGAELAGLSRLDFGREIGDRGIARHYGSDDLADDLAYAGRQ